MKTAMVWICFLVVHAVTFVQGSRTLLFVDDDKIYRLEERSKAPAEISFPGTTVGQPWSLDYDCREGRLYWCDRMLRHIRSSYLNGTDVRKVVQFKPGSSVLSMAIDDTARLVFYVNAGTKVMALVTMATGYHRTLLRRGLDLPLSLAVDKSRGILFYVDNGARPRVASVNYDGSDYSVFITKELHSPTGIAVDATEGIIYWCDRGLFTIESYDYLGYKGREQLAYIQGGKFFALDLFGDSLYATLWNDGHILRVPTGGGNATRVDLAYPLSSVVLGLRAVDLTRKTSLPAEPVGCGCSHICVPAGSGAAGWQCLCPDGLTLTADGRTCTTDPDLDHFLLFADKDLGRLYRMDLDLGHHVVLPISVTTPVAVDYDVIEDRVYWSDVTEKIIGSARLDGSERRVVKQLNVVAVPDGMELDAKARLLFYSDTGNDVIASMNLDGSNHREILTFNLDEPRALALDIHDRIVYYADWGTSPRIARITYAGKKHFNLATTDVKPNGLVLDKKTERLYWCDYSLWMIESMKTDGSDREVVMLRLKTHFFGLDLHQGFLYISDWESRSLSRVKTDGTGWVDIGANEFYHVADLHVVDKEQTLQDLEEPQERGTKYAQESGGKTTGGSPCPGGVSGRAESGTCSKDSIWEPFLLFVDKDSRQLTIMDLDTEEHENLPIGNSNPTAVAYDVIEKRVYWNDVTARVISSAHLDGADRKVVKKFREGVIPHTLKVDAKARRLFCSLTGNDVISAMNLDGSGYQEVLALNQDQPAGLALDTKDRRIYYAVWTRRPRIARVSYEGKAPVDLVTSDLGQPSGLVLDKGDERLYWCDGPRDRVERARSKDGRHREILLHRPHSHFFAMDLHGGLLYFSDWESESLQRMRTDGSRRSSFGPTDFGYISDLLLVDEEHALQALGSTSNTRGSKRSPPPL